MSMKGNNQTGHWRKLAGIGCLMLGTATGTIYAQVDAKLAELGMENIRTVQTGKGTTVAFEDRAYRSSLTGLGMAIETALNAKNGADCYSKNGDAVTVLTWQS